MNRSLFRRSRFATLLLVVAAARQPVSAVIVATYPDPVPLVASNPGPGQNEVTPIDFFGDGTPDLWFVGTDTGMAVVLAGGHRAILRGVQPINTLGPIGNLDSSFSLSAAPITLGYIWNRGRVGEDDAFLREHGLPFNTSVAQLDFEGDIGNAPGWFQNSGYIGMEFVFADHTHYGWVHVDNAPVVTDWGGYIDAWAYESEPGIRIFTGAVPEPSAAMLLSGAMAAFILQRNRRRQTNHPQATLCRE